MLKVIEILRELKDLGVYIELCGDQLKINGADEKLTSNLIAKIKNSKAEIVTFLKKVEKDNSFSTIHKVSTDLEYYPTSSEQKRLYFLQQFDENSTVYNMARVFRLKGRIDYNRFEQAIKQIIKKHEAFRTSFVVIEGIIVQQVVENIDFSIDCSEVEMEEINDVIQGFIQPFNLSKAPLLRVKLCRVRPDEHFLFIDMHHIVWDGVSWGVFIQDFKKAYQNEEIGSLRIQYKDYVVWEQSNKKDSISKQQETYWLDMFKGDIPVLDFPTDNPRPEIQNFEGGLCDFELTEGVSQSLNALCERYSVTLYMLLLSIYKVLLSKYSNAEDVIVGTISAGRDHDDLRYIIGMFVKTLAIRSKPVGPKKFADYLKEIKTITLDAFENQQFPFEELVNKLKLSRNLSRSPLLDTMFAMQNFENEKLQVGELEVERYQIKGNRSIFDISLMAFERDAKVIYKIGYCTQLFKEETIQRVGVHLSHIAKQIIENPEIPIAEIEIVTTGEKNQILNVFNSAETSFFPKDKTIHQLFQEQVIKTPEKTALVCGQQKLTYQQCNEKSEQLARYIRKNYQQHTEQSLRPDTLIALYLDRSLEMVIGILAVLKAGGAYVPIDTYYPQGWVDYILDDIEATLVLSQKHLCDDSNVQLPLSKVIHIDLVEEFYQEETSNLLQYGRAADLAAVIYTSDATGKPKGVELTHRGLTNLICTQKDRLNIDAESRILQYNPFSVDASILEVFSALSFGAEISIAPSSISQNAQLLETYLSEQKVTMALLPPAMLNKLSYNKLQDLKTLLICGDLNTLEVMSSWGEGRNLFNAYGLTEGTFISTIHKFEDGDLITNIGKPIANARAYVMDRYQNLVPVGVIGELYIGGVGLARGYLKRPDLTAERFVSNSFATEEDRLNGYTRLYRTGDLVRWLPDGSLEFIGRNDDQIKICGFRVELGEVEYALAQISGVKQCCVLVRERKTESGSSKYLAAYYVQDDCNDDLNQMTILNRLSHVLPKHMIPSVLMELDSLPLTSNGKPDKRALPEVDISLLTEEYVAPVTETEKEICEIWQELLGQNRVGVKDNFFRIGGNNFLAAQLSHRMSETLGCEVKVVDIFKHGNISALLSNITLLQVADENVNWKF